LAQERFGVAPAGVLHQVTAEDEHGQLGQVVTGQVVQLTTGELLLHRREPVAVEAGGVADPGRLANTHVNCPGCRPLPGGPANAWAISSHRCASTPSARTSQSSR